MEKLVQAVIRGLDVEFEKKVIEGLKLKGFEFPCKSHMHEIIKTRVCCTSTYESNVYTVDGEIFLVAPNDHFPDLPRTPHFDTNVYIGKKYRLPEI